MPSNQLSPVDQRLNWLQGVLTTNVQIAQGQQIFPMGIDPMRAARIALKTIKFKPELLNYDPASLCSCIIEAAALGLDIDSRGLAYFVPFGNRVNLIIGYKGFIELAYRSGRVSSIYAEVVCQNDHFEYEMGLTPKLKHTPALGERGQMLAVYAVAKVAGTDPMFVVLSNSEVNKVRSTAKTSKVWDQWPEAMAKKTAIRRLAKMLPMSPDVQMAISLDEQAEFDDQQVGQYEVIIDAPQPKAEAPKQALGEKMGVGKKTQSAPSKKAAPAPAPQPAPAPEQPQAEAAPQPAPAPRRKKLQEELAPTNEKGENINVLFADLCDKMGIDGADGFRTLDFISKQKRINLDEAKVFALNNPADFSRLHGLVMAEKEEKRG